LIFGRNPGRIEAGRGTRFKIPPDKVVRKGGYNSVDEAIDDRLGRIERLAAERRKPKVRK
jgi:hypothetical protein